MGQYAGQPDFGTFAASVTPSDTISYANNLDRSVIYIGAITGGTDLKVILSGVTRDGQVVETNITDGGTGYTGATGVATTGGSGSGLTVDTTVGGGAPGPITAIAVNAAGTGYKVGDVITISGGGADATFTVDSISNQPTSADAITFKGCQAGTFMPVVVDYVLATGTSVTELIRVK
jgi:hypothetical protein